MLEDTYFHKLYIYYHLCVFNTKLLKLLNYENDKTTKPLNY